MLEQKTSVADSEVSNLQVVMQYGTIAAKVYEDSLIRAKELDRSIQNLLENPTETALNDARRMWVRAREPYQQSEVFRFANPIVDAWEGRVNAWPLDEGLIDYVDVGSYGTGSDDNALYDANIISNSSITVGGRLLDVSVLSKELLSDSLHEIAGIEANVATGYHAIEFLLWGQDLNGTGPGAGNRPVTDFDLQNCTHGFCERRRKYLALSSKILIDDLTWMVSQWRDHQGKIGPAFQRLIEDPDSAIRDMLTGMGSLSYGELAGERIKLGLMLNDPEEEHDCFSDNTHNSHYHNIVGIQNVYLGTYEAINGNTLKGPSIQDLLAQRYSQTSEELSRAIGASLAMAKKMVESAESNGTSFDQLIAKGNVDGNALVSSLVEALLNQTQAIQAASAELTSNQINVQGSDSLDSPDAVFQ